MGVSLVYSIAAGEGGSEVTLSQLTHKLEEMQESLTASVSRDHDEAVIDTYYIHSISVDSCCHVILAYSIMRKRKQYVSWRM